MLCETCAEYFVACMYIFKLVSDFNNMFIAIVSTDLMKLWNILYEIHNIFIKAFHKCLNIFVRTVYDLLRVLKI